MDLKPDEFKRVLTPGARTVLEVLVLLGVISLLAINGYRWLKPADAVASAAVERAGITQQLEDLIKTVDEVKRDVKTTATEVNRIQVDIAVIKTKVK